MSANTLKNVSFKMYDHIENSKTKRAHIVDPDEVAQSYEFAVCLQFQLFSILAL